MNLIDALLKAMRCRQRMSRKVRGGLRIARVNFVQRVMRQGRY